MRKFFTGFFAGGLEAQEFAVVTNAEEEYTLAGAG